MVISRRSVNLTTLFLDKFIFTAAVVMPCGGYKRLPVHHHSAGYIFWSFGVNLKIEFDLSRY